MRCVHVIERHPMMKGGDAYVESLGLVLWCRMSAYRCLPPTQGRNIGR